MFLSFGKEGLFNQRLSSASTQECWLPIWAMECDHLALHEMPNTTFFFAHETTHSNLIAVKGNSLLEYMITIHTFEK